MSRRPPAPEAEEYIARAAIVKGEVDRLVDDAKRIVRMQPASAERHARLEAIEREVDVRLESLREIRREQAEGTIWPSLIPHRPWWRRLLGL